MSEKTIVTGVDGMEGGRDALHLATVLADVLEAEIVAVSAFPYFHRPALAGSPVVEAQRRATREKLERELADAAVQARSHVIADSSPGRALHRVAEKEHAALIVVGSTRRGVVGRVLIGDDALGTLHGSSVPVAVAPRGYASDRLGIRRIGVGYDDGLEARAALEVAVDLAERCGAELELVSVVANPTYLAADAAAYSVDLLEDVRREGEHALAKVIADLPRHATGSAVIGQTGDELEALSRRSDLLVVGSRAWGPVRRVLVGSTAAGLMRRALCPVLVVPRGGATGEPGEHAPDESAAESSLHV